MRKQINTLEELFSNILNKNGVTYKSIQSWMYYKHLIDDAIAELIGYLWKRYKDEPEIILKKYNNEKTWIGFISLYTRHQLQNNTSIFFRRYNTSYKFDDLNTPDGGANNNAIIDIIDSKQTTIIETPITKLRQLDGKDIQIIISRILSNKKAIELFDKEYRELYFHFYLSEPTNKIPTYGQIAEQVNISRRDLMKIIQPIRKFLKMELQALEDSGMLDKYLLMK